MANETLLTKTFAMLLNLCLLPVFIRVFCFAKIGRFQVSQNFLIMDIEPFFCGFARLFQKKMLKVFWNGKIYDQYRIIETAAYFLIRVMVPENLGSIEGDSPLYSQI